MPAVDQNEVFQKQVKLAGYQFYESDNASNWGHGQREPQFLEIKAFVERPQPEPPPSPPRLCARAANDTACFDSVVPTLVVVDDTSRMTASAPTPSNANRAEVIPRIRMEPGQQARDISKAYVQSLSSLRRAISRALNQKIRTVLNGIDTVFGVFKPLCGIAGAGNRWL
ncbi:MAG: hypothetical protein SEPTF4163_005381 [Sporothrix epigloea]